MESVDYVHLMFDDHQIVFAEGAACESFHPGHVGMAGMITAAREEMLAIFPDLRVAPGGYGPLARPSLRQWEAALL
jgi:hypothetical protein